jgi:hypothetical protein
MGKQKDAPSSDDDLDLFDDDEIPDLDEIPENSDLDINIEPRKINAKLLLKKRMDDYLERKWFRDNGWDDDDDLFNDDFFTGKGTENHRR